MSRVANRPVIIPNGVNVTINERTVSAKGKNGSLEYTFHPLVRVEQEGNILRIVRNDESADSNMHAGSTRAHVNNLVTGVSEGFKVELELVGVGYRAQKEGSSKLILTVGYSHPVAIQIPADITIEVPSQSQLVIKGADKQKVGALAAKISAVRPPEPYKGKGIRIVGKVIIRKEAKKK